MNEYHNSDLLCCWTFYIAIKFTTQFPLYRFEYFPLGNSFVQQKESIFFSKRWGQERESNITKRIISKSRRQGFYKFSPRLPFFSYLLSLYTLILPKFAQWDLIWIMPDRALNGMNCRLSLCFCGCLVLNSLGMREGTFISFFHSIGGWEIIVVWRS